MPQIRVPQLEEEAAPAAAATDTNPTEASLRPRAKTALRIFLEVALIAGGVFLGLMGEQWRENAENRERAQASLRQFRAEISNNRKALVSVMAYHTKLHQSLDAYWNSDQPKNPETLGRSNVSMRGIGPVFFERTAWDLSLATQSLAHMDQGVAYALSHAYNLQQVVSGAQAAIVQSTLYGRSPTRDFDQYWGSLQNYFGDIVLFDPMLLRAYDEALRKIDAGLDK